MLRTAVVIDYQNIHLTGHDNFSSRGVGAHETLLTPRTLASNLISRRNAGQRPGFEAAELAHVEVFRGQPSQRREPERYAITQAEKARWEDDVVEVNYRPLKYYTDEADNVKNVREKGIDVLCALSLLRLAAQPTYDLVIMMSHDSDLDPALDAAIGMRGARVETAGWANQQIYPRRLRASGSNRAWHTYLTETDFLNSLDPQRHSPTIVPPAGPRAAADVVQSPQVVYTTQS